MSLNCHVANYCRLLRFAHAMNVCNSIAVVQCSVVYICTAAGHAKPQVVLKATFELLQQRAHKCQHLVASNWVDCV